MFFFIKIASSALVIGIITELARKLPKVGGIVAAIALLMGAAAWGVWLLVQSLVVKI